MPVVSQSIIRPMVPVGASTDGLRVAHAELLAELARLVPRLLGGATSSSAGTSSSSMLAAASRCMLEHPEHVLRVLGEAGERAHAGGDAGRRWRRRGRS